jgi:SAM-dependent methyltransferase
MSPSPFIVEQIEVRRAARAGERPRALDVAMGHGRHAIPLARAGFDTFGVDLSIEAVRGAIAHARQYGLRLRAWCADLTLHPLPRARFDVVVVTRYLQRDLFPSLRASAAIGGVVLYETFTTAQRLHGVGPTSPDHLLDPGELRARFDVAGWDVLGYEEALEPEAVARLVARRRA